MTNKKNEPQHVSNLDEVIALKELIAVVVDYYCFKNNDLNDMDDDDDEEDNYLKNKLSDLNPDEESSDIIPQEINSLIEDSFKSQLKKFI